MISESNSIKMQLLLVDYIKENADSSAAITQGLDIGTWFNNHSCALHILYMEQRTFVEFTQALTLLKPQLTCWGTHATTIGCLIKLEKPLITAAVKRHEDLHTAAGKKSDAMKKANDIIALILCVSFWATIKM
jgi:hypothetical protein